MKLKEYATKIKNRLVGQRAKPQEEEKDDLSEKIAERTQELISNNRRKMKGMPMIRAKAIEKARRNKRRKPKK